MQATVMMAFTNYAHSISGNFDHVPLRWRVLIMMYAILK